MEQNTDLIPIRELEKITGFKRSTIHYYIKEGLLPEPEKSALNMSYYDRGFVERLKVIKIMKDEHKLNLKQIKSAFKAASYGVDADTITQIRNGMLHKIASNSDFFPVTWEEFLNQTNLTEEEIDSIKKHIILIFSLPNSDGSDVLMLHPDSIVAGKLLHGLIKMGIPLITLKQLFKQLVKIVEIETESFIMNVLKPMHERNDSTDNQIESIKMGVEFADALMSMAHFHLLNRPIFSSEKWINLIDGKDLK